MNNLYTQRAIELAEKGYTVIPLNGKVPMVEKWQEFRRVTPDLIMAWEQAGKWKNIGMVCGAASNNVVVIDFDGMPGYELFKLAFPELVNTMTVATGSGNGMHCYYKVDLLPDSRAVMSVLTSDAELINIEFKSDGKQVVIPPSIHPDTGNEYTVVNRAPIMHVPDLAKVWAWAQSLKPEEVKPWTPPTQYSGDKNLNRKLLSALENHFRSQPHKMHGDWINCSCPNASAHKHGDRTPSFGFNTSDGGANCYNCGGMSIKQMCGYLNIDPVSYGGIYEKSEQFNVQQATNPVNNRQSSSVVTPSGAGDTGIPVVKRSERLTNYINRLTDFDTPRTVIPVPFPLRAVQQFNGMARVIKPGKVVGIVGVSGGGKTSLLETMVDGWLSMHVPCLVWSPEWDADEFIERAVQRYGGPRTDELYMHEIFIQEQQQGIVGGVGVEMPPAKLESAVKAVGMLRQFKEEVGYLDFPFLNAGYLQAEIDKTLKNLSFKPRVLIIDYVQLLYAMETDSNLTMYNLLMRLKAICAAYGLVGVLATQVTKEGTKGQQNGGVLDSLSARYVNDDAFNLFITINPDRDENGLFLPSAVLNVAKNSVGMKGKVRVAVNWERLAFDDRPHPNQVFKDDE